MSITTVPFSALLPGTTNPRKVSDEALIDGLAESIKADGLLHNLVVQPAKRRKYRVIAGNRRYRALAKLKAAGAIDGDYMVPVEIRRASRDEAFRLATVENVQREALDPIDEAEAFATLFQNGAAIDDVVARIGTSESTIRRRLALANLCDEAKEMVRSGELALGVAEALTLGTPDAQREILARQTAGYVLDADDVRYLLTEGKPTVAMAIFALEEYEGSLTTDLFGSPDTTYFDDPEEFHRLQDAAVEKLTAEQREAGKWVDVIRSYTAPWWQYRQAEEGEAAGTVIHLAPNGRVEVRENLARHDVDEKTAEATCGASGNRRERAAHTAALVRYVAFQKSFAVQAALFEQPRKAKEVAVLMLLAGFHGSGRVRLTLHPCWTATLDDQRSKTIVAEQCESLLGLIAKPDSSEPEDGRPKTGAVDHLVTLGWHEPDLHERLAALPEEVLDRLLYLLPVLCFGQGNVEHIDDGDTLFNHVASSLQLDLRHYWKPDEAFLAEHRKDELERIAFASGAAVGITKVHGMKKSELVRILTAFFDRTASAEPHAYEPYERGRTWLPKIIGFPADPAMETDTAE